MSFRAFTQASGDLPAGLEFRDITNEDKEFLYQLYASTRQQEMELMDWTLEQKSSFLAMQFDAQHSFYMEQFKQAEFLLIEKDGEPIGRLYIDWRESEIRLIDIALLPTVRNQGLGTALLTEVLREGQAGKLPVSIHVEKNNPAMRLYLKLGFIPVEDHGVYDLMCWHPPTS